MLREKCRIFHRKQRNGFGPEPADNLRRWLLQSGRSRSDQLEKIFIRIVAERGKGAIDTGGGQKPFPRFHTQFGGDDILEQIKNDSLHICMSRRECLPWLDRYWVIICGLAASMPIHFDRQLAGKVNPTFAT